jgi:hypothetical protein
VGKRNIGKTNRLISVVLRLEHLAVKNVATAIVCKGKGEERKGKETIEDKIG